ncbi:hypothetical protein ACERIT_10540 [Halopenitus sp. H-Gu1]|uniref:hypothetical protein n=1 Tax=Halopenitus sp. H-Gu1 TaxID=3242697 RepID=UPI00359DB6D0
MDDDATDPDDAGDPTDSADFDDPGADFDDPDTDDSDVDDADREPIDLSERHESEATTDWTFGPVDESGTNDESAGTSDDSAGTSDDSAGTSDELAETDEPVEEVSTEPTDADRVVGLDETMSELETGSDSIEADVAGDPFTELDADDGFSASAADRSGSDSTIEDGDDDPFQQMDVDVVTDDVWESLDAEGSSFEIGGEAKLVDEDERYEEHLVAKRQYCHRCPHFSAPPTVECNHEETTIVEVIGVDEFRVRNCPMVTDGEPEFDRTDR